MVDNNFKISKVNGTIFIEKNGEQLAISKLIDDDIFFSTSKDELLLEISMSSRNHSEWQAYMLFENLLKSIVGRYMLNGDNKKENSRLPKDFIDLDNKVITWHSDSGIDNILKFSYNENSITITMEKRKNSSNQENNSVRIRTSGSRYEYYYQEFSNFFDSLRNLENKLNKRIESIEQKNEAVPIQKKLSLFGKNKK